MKKSDLIGTWKLRWAGNDPEKPAPGDENLYQGVLVYGRNSEMYCTLLTLKNKRCCPVDGFPLPCFQGAHSERAKPDSSIDAGFWFSYRARFRLLKSATTPGLFQVNHELIQSTFPTRNLLLSREARITAQGHLALKTEDSGSPPTFFVWERITSSKSKQPK